MTAPDFTELEGLLERATLGPWAVDGDFLVTTNAAEIDMERVVIADLRYFTIPHLYANAALIVWLVNNAEALLSAAKRADEATARAERAEARVGELEAENEALRLEMLGGEDAPGYAASLTMDQVLNSFRAQQSFARHVSETAQAKVRELRQAFAELADLPPAIDLPKHRYWGAGEADCPKELKAPNGELHTMRCKVCGNEDLLNSICRPRQALEPTHD